MSEAFVGEIRAMPYTFVPNGWLDCDGRELNISEYGDLFSVISNNFGGDGITTFMLPNINNRVPVCTGANPELTARTLGDTWGTTNVTLNSTTMPTHTHDLKVSSNNTELTTDPTGAVLGSQQNLYTEEGSSTKVNMATDMTFQGGGNAHNNMSAYTVMRFYICHNGEIPTAE